MIFFCGVLYIRQSWQLWKELVLSRAHAPCAVSSPITLELLAPPKALCIQREKVDCGNFIWGYTLIATSSVCANFSCLMSPLPFSTLAMKRRSSVVGLSISGQRRFFAVEITELKKGRRGQGIINVPKAAWAKPDPQKHLETCAANVWLSCCHSGRLQAEAGADQSHLLMFTQEWLWPTGRYSISWAWGTSWTLRKRERFAISCT